MLRPSTKLFPIAHLGRTTIQVFSFLQLEEQINSLSVNGWWIKTHLALCKLEIVDGCTVGGHVINLA